MNFPLSYKNSGFRIGETVLKEVQVLRDLNHINIVRYVDHWVPDGDGWLHGGNIV